MRSTYIQQTRLHLQAAVDEFRQLETFRTTLISESLQETDQDRLANRCPACFGPRDEQFETSTGKTARDSDIIVNLDGNFSQSRTENAAKYDPLNLNPLIFLHPDRVNEARREVEQSAHIKGVVSSQLSQLAELSKLTLICPRMLARNRGKLLMVVRSQRYGSRIRD